MSSSVFLGWHKSIYNSPRIDKWLDDRKFITKQALSTFIGGNNVFSYMLQNGWFDWTVQVKPLPIHEEKHVVIDEKLDDHEICLLQVNRKQIIGFVDKRLTVFQPFIQTPVLVPIYNTFSDGMYYHPFSFNVYDKSKQISYLKSIKKLCIAAETILRKENSQVSVMLITRHCDIHAPINKNYPIFDSNGKKCYNEKFEEHKLLRLIMKCDLHYAYAGNYTIEFHILQSQLMGEIDHGCLMGDDDD